MALPEYACAVIADGRGRLLLELRPPAARHAGDQLTCFGGRREGDEDALACLVRELREELAWAPTACEPACDLWSGRRWIARFFACGGYPDPPRTEAGRIAVWAPWRSLPGLPLSPWHRAVLATIAAGQRRCEVG